MPRIKPTMHAVSLPPATTPRTVLQADVAAEALSDFIGRHRRLFILTGAGISTESGIPDYRDDEGGWKRKQPVQHQAFMADEHLRKRYWARSLVGWPVIRNARPNPAHHHLAELEQRDCIHQVVTQNVDRLHQYAGSERVLDLHGRADEVLCMSCGYRCRRDDVHDWCSSLNPSFRDLSADHAPDGDADLELDFTAFNVANCPHCDGILKPDVVFFGDFVPKTRVDDAKEALQASDGLLAIGSSLMVYSGFRFCRYAQEWGKPIATLNLGRTRADAIADLTLNARIGETLSHVLDQL